MSERIRRQRNYIFQLRLPKQQCIDAAKGEEYTCEPHVDRKSSHYHAHIVSMDETMNHILGENHKLRIIKATPYRSLFIQGGSRTRRRKWKKTIIREVTIKTPSLIQDYVLCKLSGSQELLRTMFKPNCDYGFIQLIMGLPITNTSMPQDHQEIFNIYLGLFDEPANPMVLNLPKYIPCLSSIKEIIASANSDCISEAFHLRL
ncbi:hypothetical protein K501DRAFT_275535 [Backusella circina FSU 941]|nr:hypothetical protein K501DRAFT_275535 [Backusella circina FSU 941]